MPDAIPYGRQWLDEDEVAVVVDVLRLHDLLWRTRRRSHGELLPAVFDTIMHLSGQKMVIQLARRLATIRAWDVVDLRVIRFAGRRHAGQPCESL